MDIGFLGIDGRGKRNTQDELPTYPPIPTSFTKTSKGTICLGRQGW